MRLTDFHFDLPDSAIACHPPERRRDARLLYLSGKTGELRHQQFTDLLDYVSPGDVMVFNNTRVFKARCFGRKATGGKIEVLVERVLDKKTVIAHVKASKSPAAGSQLILDEDVSVTVVGREGDLFKIKFTVEESVFDILDKIGHVPLPPYIKRPDNEHDINRYQTVYAQSKGSVAAPTAGLHFDEAMLQALRDKGVLCEFVTLHVGAGTFQPVRVANIVDHEIHAEYIEVSEQVCQAVQTAKKAGHRVIAVGTTSTRALETASASGEMLAYAGDTNLYIYPGYEFNCVDMMVTNFHLPESSLLILVCAFAGYEHVMHAYRTAVKSGYRFYSYGDAMLIEVKGSDPLTFTA